MDESVFYKIRLASFSWRKGLQNACGPGSSSETRERFCFRSIYKKSQGSQGNKLQKLSNCEMNRNSHEPALAHSSGCF